MPLGEYTYTWPVDVDVPKDGRHVRARVKVTFRRLLTNRMQEIVDTGDPATADIRLLREAVAGWEGDLAAVLGEPLDYSPDALEDVLQVSYVRLAMGRAYTRSIGLPEAERKN